MPFSAGQIKSRARVRDLAEVYTNKREVDAMLDLVTGMFPSPADPGNIDRTFLEPACGSGNFLEAILRRKLAFVTTDRYGAGEGYEHAILRCVVSIYGIDICDDNAAESRHRMRDVIGEHVHRELRTTAASPELADAVQAVLQTNIVCADALDDAHAIEIVAYQSGPRATFLREWSWLDAAANEPTLFSIGIPRRDALPIHYSELSQHPEPVVAAESMRGAA